MRRLATIFLVLTSCGVLSSEDVNVITVRRYEDAAGNPTPNPDSLGFTYYMDHKGGAKHSAAGFNCLINEDLLLDADPDKIVRVIIHELGQALILKDDDTPEWEPGWYTFDSDTLPPEAPITIDEAIWFAHHSTMPVKVKDEWLADPVGIAIDRVNFAAQAPVFERR